MTQDVNVVLLNFPKRGNEMVVENEDGSYTIIINAKLSYQGQLNAYRHAMQHIESGDFQKTNVQSIEAAAHSTETPKVLEGRKCSQSRECPDWLKAIRARNKKLHRELGQYIEVYDSYDLSDSKQWFG